MLLIIRQSTAEKSKGLLGILEMMEHHIDGVCVLGTSQDDFGFGVETVNRSLSRDVPGESWPVISACEDIMQDAGISPTETLLVSENDDARMLIASVVLDCRYISIEEIAQLYG